MAEPEQQRDLDPVGRQVDALKLLERLVAGRVEAEARVDRERNARVDAAERTTSRPPGPPPIATRRTGRRSIAGPPRSPRPPAPPSRRRRPTPRRPCGSPAPRPSASSARRPRPSRRPRPTSDGRSAPSARPPSTMPRPPSRRPRTAWPRSTAASGPSATRRPPCSPPGGWARSTEPRVEPGGRRGRGPVGRHGRTPRSTRRRLTSRSSTASRCPASSGGRGRSWWRPC